MGTLTPIVGAVGGDLPASTEVPGRPLSDVLLTSSFTEREAAWGFQPSAAINNSIETGWVHAIQESFSTDRLLLEGTVFSLQPLSGVLI